MSKADRRARKNENKAKARAAAVAAQKRRSRFSLVKRGAVFVVSIVILGGGFALLVNRDDDKTAETTTLPPTETTAATSTTVTLPEGCDTTTPEKSGNGKQYDEPGDAELDPAKFYTAVVDTTCGQFTIALSKDAPKTVNSFVFLARDGFFDGLTFHRVGKDFVIQGGDPEGNGSGGPGYTIEDEPPKNGYVKGSVAMANSGPGTSGSQFFIALTDQGAQGLGAAPPYQYSDLGIVIDGFDTVEKLGTLYNPDQDPSQPSTQRTSMPLYIFSVTIEESTTAPTTAAPTTAAPTTAAATTTTLSP